MKSKYIHANVLYVWQISMTGDGVNNNEDMNIKDDSDDDNNNDDNTDDGND